MKNNDTTSKLVKEKKHSVPTVKQFVVFFTVFFACNMFIILVLGFATGGDAWKAMLFHNGSYTDLFMDFFNSVRDGGSENVYSERNNIYPPLCILLFRIFSKLINPSLVSSPFNKRGLLQLDQVCVMIYILFTIVCILAMLRIIETFANSRNGDKLKTQAALISFLMIISYPVVYCIERGNILLLSVIFSMFFVFFKDSPNKVVRELSYISLAFAAGIKIYPAILGLTLVIEKKYKQALRLILYGIIVVAAPIVFFIDFSPNKASAASSLPEILKFNLLSISADADGSASVITKILKNLLSFATTKKSTFNLSSVSIQNIVYLIFGSGSSTLARIVCGFTEVFAFALAFGVKKEWQKIFLLCYLMLNIPSASSSYALSFLIIPFCIFLFDTRGYNKSDWLFMGSFTLLLTPLPTLWYFHPEKVAAFFDDLGYKYNSQLNQDIATIVFQFIFLFVAAELIVTSLSAGRKKVKTASGSVSARTLDASTDTVNENGLEANDEAMSDGENEVVPQEDDLQTDTGS